MGIVVQEGGLERALYETGAAGVFNDSQKQRLVAMVCSYPPAGGARSLDGAAGSEETVKRKPVPRVGRGTIRIRLLSHDFEPCRKKCG